ncbi:MAG: hypothetical protein J2P25_25545 [Nocardiopsaceae bacterium]|nr:hypothetical protein [Nocardiopsaceae bacterium]
MNDTDTDTADRRRKRARGAGAGIALALIAAAAIVAVAGGGGQHRPSAGTRVTSSPPASPPTSRPTNPPAGAAPANTSCRTAPPSNSVPATPPRDLAWRNVGAVLVPTSATEGPTRYAGATWSCYAHSPTGAVLAAYGILATLTSPRWKEVAEREILPGPGRRAFIHAGEKQKYKPPKPGQVAQPVGFQVVSYTPRQATVSALASDGGGQYQVTQISVAWSGGDWKLVVTPDGRTGPNPQAVSSAAGFTLWGGGGNGR